MSRLRILLACPRMTQTDLWKMILSQDADIELVGEADGAIEALIMASDTQPTAVVIDLPSNGQDPGLYSHLLEENPQVKVIAVSHDGSRAVKYERGILRRQVEDTSPQTLNKLFHSLWLDQDPILSDFDR